VSNRTAKCPAQMYETVPAITDLDRAIAVDRRATRAVRAERRLHRTAGDGDAALADTRKAVELEPSRAYRPRKPPTSTRRKARPMFLARCSRPQRQRSIGLRT
jgi:hypothetical protein